MFVRHLMMRDEGENGSDPNSNPEPSSAASKRETSQEESGRDPDTAGGLLARVERCEQELARYASELAEHRQLISEHVAEYEHKRAKQPEPAGEPGPKEAHWFYR